MTAPGQVTVILPGLRLPAVVLAGAGADRRVVAVTCPPPGEGEFG